MDPEPKSPNIGTALWLPCADAHGVRYVDCGKSFGEVAQDHRVSSDAHHELLATDRTGATSATHEAFARTTDARALLTDEAIRRPGGDLDCHVDPVQVLDPAGQIVPRRPAPEAGGEWESIATPGAAHPEVRQPHDPGVTVVSDPELPLPDVPLIVEDLLMQASQLAGAGAPNEALEEIFDHVAALREGRG
jgi:hypothetical protein